MNVADVVVVGGGPAGLATAIACRRHGLEVVVLERGEVAIDRPCGEGIMPEGVAALARLGVDLSDRDGRRFHGIRWLDGDLRACGHFSEGAGYGVRRTTLHRRLAEQAAADAVELRWGCAARGLSSDGVDSDRGPCPARWVIGADGRASRVRQWAGLAAPAPLRGRVGVRRHLELAPWSDEVEVYWADGVEAYVTPVGPRMVGIAAMWQGAAGRFDEAIARIPNLARRIAGAAAVSRDAGAGPFGQRARRVTRGQVLLVGDAGGGLDPITGEGLGLAFRQAECLAEAVAAGRPAVYEAAWRRLRRSPARLNRLVLLLADRPWLRRRVVAALAADEGLFDRLLALRGGTGGVVRTGLAPLAWRMLRTPS